MLLIVNRCDSGTRAVLWLSYENELRTPRTRYAFSYYPTDGSYNEEDKSAFLSEFSRNQELPCWVDNSNEYNNVQLNGVPEDYGDAMNNFLICLILGSILFTYSFILSKWIPLDDLVFCITCEGCTNGGEKTVQTDKSTKQSEQEFSDIESQFELSQSDSSVKK